MKLLIPRKSIALIVKHNGDEDLYTDGCTLGCLCGQRYSSNTIRFDEEVYYPNNVDIQLYSDDNYVTTIDTEQFIKLIYGYQASKTIEYTIESIKPEIELDDGKFVTFGDFITIAGTSYTFESMHLKYSTLAQQVNGTTKVCTFAILDLSKSSTSFRRMTSIYKLDEVEQDDNYTYYNMDGPTITYRAVKIPIPSIPQ